MAISFTKILLIVRQLLYAAFFRILVDLLVIIFIAVFPAVLYLFVWLGVDLPNKNLENDYKWIEKERRLLSSLQEDVEDVLNSGSQIDLQAHKLWQAQEPNKGMTARLQVSEIEWKEKCRELASQVDDLNEKLEHYDKTFKSRMEKLWFGNQIRNVKSEIERSTKIRKEDIYGTLKRLRSTIRNLQDRPIGVERKADDVYEVDKRTITDLLADIQKVEKLIHGVEKVDKPIANLPDDVHKVDEPIIVHNLGLPPDIEGEIQSFTLHLALIRAFLTNLQSFGIETKTERCWLEEAKDIVEAHLGITDFIKETINQKGKLSFFSTQRARSELRKEMKSINTGFSDLLERKKRYGFTFVRSIIRRVPSKYDSGAPQRQASIVRTSEDDLDIKSNLQKLKEKYRLPSDENEKLLQVCKKFEEVHRKFEEAKKKEGINSSTEERLKQMKKLAKKTVCYIEIYKKNSVKEGKLDKLLNNAQKKLYKEIEQIMGALDLLERIMEAYSIELKEEMGVIGLDEDIQAVVSKLIRPGSEQVVSIVGMIGIGKTTLAKNIFEDSAIVDYFPARAWVPLTQSADYEAVLKEVAKQVSELNESLEKDKGSEYWMNKVCDILKKKRYLVVLDNYTAERGWETLKQAFPKTEGSRILLTTCYRSEARKFDESSKLHQLRLRTKEESWRLFIQTETVNFGSATKEVKKLTEEFVGRCGGLPLEILQFGYLMSGKDVNDKELPNVLKHIKTPTHVAMNYLSKLIELKIVSKELSDNLSKFFSFFNLFPRDYEIPARRLVTLSVAGRLVEGCRDDINTPTHVAMNYLSELIDLNLIQAVEMNINGKVKTCRLPSALREHNFFQTTSSKNHLADQFDINSDSFNDIHGNGINSPKFQQRYKNLISYLSFDTREGNKPGEEIGNFLHMGIANGCFQSLKVLDLEHVFRPQLPNTIRNLVQLMYLGLRWTYLEEIPSSIGNLLNLQTLDVKHTYVSTLPKSILKLQKLQHLYLNHRHRSKFVSHPRGSSLKNLQTLWGLFLDDVSAVKNGLNKLINLRKLGLAFQLELPKQNTLAEWVKNLSYLESLKLRSVGEKGEPLDLHLESLSGLKNLSSLYLFGKLDNPSNTLSIFPPNLSNLTLSASGLKDDPMPTLGELPSLKLLSFYCGSYKGKQMVCIEKSFSQLQVLKLWKLESLEELQVEEGAMKKLRELDIRSCKTLKVPTGLKHLISLQELKLTNMEDDFTTTIENEKWQIWYDIALPPRITKEKWESELRGT